MAIFEQLSQYWLKIQSSLFPCPGGRTWRTDGERAEAGNYVGPGTN
jgi:hypothetical protein